MGRLGAGEVDLHKDAPLRQVPARVPLVRGRSEADRGHLRGVLLANGSDANEDAEEADVRVFNQFRKQHLNVFCKKKIREVSNSLIMLTNRSDHVSMNFEDQNMECIIFNNSIFYFVYFVINRYVWTNATTVTNPTLPTSEQQPSSSNLRIFCVHTNHQVRNNNATKTGKKSCFWCAS